MSSTQGSGHQCDICFKFLSSSSSLRVHKIRHRPKDELPFHCMFCPYKSAAKRDLLYHHNQHVGHVRQVYKCDLCSKVFQRSSSLSEHINSAHSKADLYHCEKCNYSTSSRSSFRAHQQVHSGPQIKLICPICESFFKNKASLKFHLMTHADAKPFQCDKCDKKFSIRKRLLAHVRVIHCPKMFTCNECQKSFATLLNLHRHSLTHSGERPFECCFCSSTSNTRGNIVKHVRKVHNMVNYTFKDIQRENGLREDPKANLTPEDLQKVTMEGRIMSHYYINEMKKKGLTDLSLDQIERAAELKRNHKEEVASRSAARAARRNILKYSANKSSDVHKFESKTQRRSNSLANKVSKLHLEAPVAHNIVIQPDESGGGGSREGLSQFSSTTTPIQVIWRGSGGTLELSTTGNRKTKRTTSKRKTAPPPKEELSKQPVQTPSLDSSSSLTNLNSASAAPHEDTELSLQCKSLLSNDQDNQSHVLATLSSNNAPSEFVDLEELSSCSSVAISSNANLEVIDKNGDYCHFLGMEAEVGPSFLHSFESVVSQGAVCKVDSTFHHEPLNKTCQDEHVSDNYQQHVHSTSPNLQTESQTIFQSVVEGNDIDSSNNVGTSFKIPEKKTSSRTKSSSEEIVQVDSSVDCLIPNFGDDGNEPRSNASPEPTGVTERAEFDPGTEFLSIIPLVEGGSESDFQSSKEILIRNVQLDESIPNGEVNITSIAEIRVEEESDVILLVDCFR